MSEIRPRLQIVRGLPGSGKSSYANLHWPHLLRLEFDYFCMRGGAYSFGENRNAEGRHWLSTMIGSAIDHGIDFVVAGVFAGRSENLSGVVNRAIGCGYDVWIQTLLRTFGDIHGVRPADRASMERDFVGDAELRTRFAGLHVVFGSMPTEFRISPMEDGR